MSLYYRNRFGNVGGYYNPNNNFYNGVSCPNGSIYRNGACDFGNGMRSGLMQNVYNDNLNYLMGANNNLAFNPYYNNYYLNPYGPNSGIGRSCLSNYDCRGGTNCVYGTCQDNRAVLYDRQNYRRKYW
jgi:hypothetical protein